ncbi:MAG: nucleotidyltransferase [Alphaproteobacteria bacterium]|nr:MAG: nucleotidyltransferase [Alphaproteobacteria bacterium]
MRPSEALARNRDKMLAILARYPVSNPRVFGSVARGEDGEDSDLDLMVEKDGPLSYFDLCRIEDELATVVGVKVSVHTAGEFGPRARRRIDADLRAL